MIGKHIRLNHILGDRTKKAVIVAIDHGLNKPREGLENMKIILENVIQGQPDGILLTPGSIKRYYHFFESKFSPSLIVRVDRLTDIGKPIISIEDAIALGATAALQWLLLNEKYEILNLDYIHDFISDADRFGLPLILETHVVDSQTGKELADVESIKSACRFAAEIGADAVKAPYVGSLDGMKEVVKWCSIPILVLGGARMKSEIDMLEVIKNSIEAGCAGCVVGRNVWQHPYPKKVIEALKMVVHENKSIEEVIKFMG
jgi:DhnA family fructose-bisphosphate aldolase class Ia